MSDGQKNRDDNNDARLKGLVGGLIVTNQCLILHAKNTGARMNVQDTTVTGTVLLATEFRNFYAPVIMLPSPPPNLQSNFDGCAISFDLRHVLICCKRGLVITCHNKVCDELLYLVR